METGKAPPAKGQTALGSLYCLRLGRYPPVDIGFLACAAGNQPYDPGEIARSLGFWASPETAARAWVSNCEISIQPQAVQGSKGRRPLAAGGALACMVVRLARPLISA